MSLESLVAGRALNKSSSDSLLFAIQNLDKSINKLIAFQPKPTTFLRSNLNILSSNVADGVLILDGPTVPQGHKGIVEDFNVNFTTAAGTVRLVVMDANNQVVNNILRDINSSTNGTGKTILEEGQRMAIVGQSAGAGTFGVYVSGFLQRVKE